MERRNDTGLVRILVLGLLLVASAVGSGPAAIKVRVAVDNANVKATPAIGGQNVATLPLETVLEAESKQGEWYKVQVVREGVQVSGYIHELLVVEISEAEAQQAQGSQERARGQSDIIAEIERRVEENKRLVRQEIESDKVVEDLSPLVAKAFAIDDRQEQKRIAGELFFWIGQACAKKGDFYAALKNFRSMFDVDSAVARALTNNVAEPSISRLIDQAERIYKGLLIDYSLQVSTKPKEADLKINGKAVGMTPYIYRSPIPKISMSIEKPGFRTIQEEIFLTEPTTTKEYAMTSVGRNLLLRSSPPGARVFLDGQDTRAATDCELPCVPYGTHAIRLVLDNYAPSEATVDVLEGEGPLTLSATLFVNAYIFANKNGGPAVTFFRAPRAVAYDKEGNYYVVDESDVRIKKFNQEGRFLAAWGGAGREARVLRVPGGMAVDAAGNIYVTDMKACCVLKFDQTGRYVTKWGEEGASANELSRPSGIAVDAVGDLYVADTNNGRIVKYGPDGTVKKTWGTQGTKPGEFVYPAAVAVSRKGELIVADLSRIQKMTLDGVPIASWGKVGMGEGEMRSPQGVFVDGFDSVYVADTGNNRILKFDPNGKLICQWGGAGTGDGQMASPVSVAVSGNGNVMVVEKDNHRYQVFKIPGK